jgi:hypothetical protein
VERGNSLGCFAHGTGLEPIDTSSFCKDIAISDGTAHGTNLDRRDFDLTKAQSLRDILARLSPIENRGLAGRAIQINCDPTRPTLKFAVDRDRASLEIDT